MRSVSEDQRVNRNSREPAKTDPDGSRRWVGYLHWLREDIVQGVLDLPEAERRTSRLPSGWSPIELLSHVLHMEQRWFVWGFLGESVGSPWGDWSEGDPPHTERRGPDAPRWAVAADVTVEHLVTELRAVGARTSEIIESHRPDAVAAVGGRFSEDPPTLEWICFHVLAEYARHAGHLDIVVEHSKDERERT